MCVTSGPAHMSNTSAYAYAVTRPGDSRSWHVVGYQNTAQNLSGQPNCMILHFPGTELRLSRGPETTHHLMADMTAGVPDIAEPLRMRGASRGGTFGLPVIERYGDYTTVLPSNLDDIDIVVEALARVEEERRPRVDGKFRDMLRFFGQERRDHQFGLACFGDEAHPKHPIVFEYVPHNDDVLTVPGIDGHDGTRPKIGSHMQRGFRLAFGVEGHQLPHPVRYTDTVNDAWAPSSIAGFNDNDRGVNEDYAIPRDAITEGLTGRALLDSRVL